MTRLVSQLTLKKNISIFYLATIFQPQDQVVIHYYADSFLLLKGTNAALVAMGNLIDKCPEFRTVEETAGLMNTMVKLLADAVNPRWLSWEIQLTALAADKVVFSCRKCET